MREIEYVKTFILVDVLYSAVRFTSPCGFITEHIPNVEYTPGFWFKVQKKNHVDLCGTHKCVF